MGGANISPQPKEGVTKIPKTSNRQKARNYQRLMAKQSICMYMKVWEKTAFNLYSQKPQQSTTMSTTRTIEGNDL